jgi:hypothetical protein
MCIFPISVKQEPGTESKKKKKKKKSKKKKKRTKTEDDDADFEHKHEGDSESESADGKKKKKKKFDIKKIPDEERTIADMIKHGAFHGEETAAQKIRTVSFYFSFLEFGEPKKIKLFGIPFFFSFSQAQHREASRLNLKRLEIQRLRRRGEPLTEELAALEPKIREMEERVKAQAAARKEERDSRNAALMVAQIKPEGSDLARPSGPRVKIEDGKVVLDQTSIILPRRESAMGAFFVGSLRWVRISVEFLDL